MGKNLTRTLALSVTSFPILCLVLIFHSPVPHVHSPIPVACFEYHPSHGSLDIVKKKQTNKQNEHNRNINHAILNADLVRQSVDICKQYFRYSFSTLNDMHVSIYARQHFRVICS